MSTTVEILSWHGIPTGVRARDENGEVVAHLPRRFQVAVDALAMKTGLVAYEPYLAGFEYSEPAPHEGSAGEAASAVAAALAEEYSPSLVKAISREVEARLGPAGDAASPE